MQTTRQFWMVYGLDRGPPRFRHDTKTSADREAKRLAEEAPGEIFVVLTVVGAWCVDRPVAGRILVEVGDLGEQPIDGPGHHFDPNVELRHWRKL